MIKTIFQQSNETYGVDRICGELRKRGKTASYHRVKGFMDDMGLILSISVDVKNPSQTAVKRAGMSMSI